MYKNKQYISLFFLVFFMFIKTAGLHALSHSENDLNINDCDLCEFIVTSNNNLFTDDNQVYDKPIINSNYCSYTSFYYNYLFSQDQIDSLLFSRPPPTT